MGEYIDSCIEQQKREEFKRKHGIDLLDDQDIQEEYGFPDK